MDLLLFLLANTGLPVSLQTLSKSLVLPSVTRTSQYAAFLQDAYLLFTVSKYSASFEKRVVAPPKYYAIDNGLRGNIISASIRSTDTSNCFPNMRP